MGEVPLYGMPIYKSLETFEGRTVSDYERLYASQARTSPPRDDVRATARLHSSISGLARPGLTGIRPLIV